MEKMENIVFDRNYEEDKPDPLAQAIFDRVNAPGGFLEEFSKKMDAIPKVIVPKDKKTTSIYWKDAMSLQSVITARFMVSLTTQRSTVTST